MATEFDTNKKVRNVLMKRFSCFDGVGVDLRGAKSFDEAMEVAGLNYEVVKQQMFLSDGTRVNNHFCTVKSDTNSQLGVVGKDYSIVNNRDAFDVAETIVNDGLATYEAGGVSLKAKYAEDYSKTFMVLRHDDFNILGDDFNSFSVLRNSFDGSSGVQMMFVNLRLICLNGLTRQMPGQKHINRITITHCDNAVERIQVAKITLAKQHQYVEALKYEAEKLATTKFSKAEFTKEIIPLVLKELKLDKEDRKRGSDNLDLTIERLVSAYEADDVQNFNNTAYKVLLTLSDFESHTSPLKDTNNPHLYFNRVLSGMVLTNTAVNYILKTRGVMGNKR